MFGSGQPQRLLGENDASFFARRAAYTASPSWLSEAQMLAYAGLEKQPTPADPDPLHLLPPQRREGESNEAYAKRWREFGSLAGDERAAANESYHAMQAKRAAEEAERRRCEAPKAIVRLAHDQRPKRSVSLEDARLDAAAQQRDDARLARQQRVVQVPKVVRSPRAPSANRPPPLWMLVAALVQQRIVLTVRKHWWKAILAAGAATEVVTHVPHFR